VGSAKSFSLLFKTLTHIAKPGSRGILGRRHMPELHATLWRDFFDIVPPDWIAPKGIDRARHSVRFRNGSLLDFVHLADPSRVKGPTVSYVGIDEATEVPEDSFRMLRMRLRQPGFTGQLFAATNPGGRSHYLFRDFVDPSTRAHGNAYHCASSLENVFVPPEYHDDLLRSFSGDYARRYIEGEWIDWEGRVWPSFTDLNVLDAGSTWIPPEWQRDLAIDFGYEHSFACLWIAWDPRVSPPRMVVYDEHVERRKTLREHAEAIRLHRLQERQPFLGYQAAWADHDAQDRHELASLPPDLRIVTRPARKHQRALALTAMEAAFKPRQDGVPGVLVMSNCRVTIDQWRGFRRPRVIPASDPDAVVETNERGESIDDTCDAGWMGYWSRIGDHFESEPHYQPGMDDRARSRIYRGWREGARS
jgi:hypothetical protein